MWKATIRGLFARKVRLALTALAILLGVAFVSATYVLTDSVKQSFESVFAQTLTGVDLHGAGRHRPSATASTAGPHPGVDHRRRCAAVPGVRTAQGFVQTSLAQFVDRRRRHDRRRRSADVRRLVGRSGPFRLTDGHAARRRRPGGDGRRHRREARVPRSATTCACC